jgi:hypothetical protein
VLRTNRPFQWAGLALSVPETVSGVTDVDLISYFMAIPDGLMRCETRLLAWYLLLVAVLGILSRSKCLFRDF